MDGRDVPDVGDLPHSAPLPGTCSVMVRICNAVSRTVASAAERKINSPSGQFSQKSKPSRAAFSNKHAPRSSRKNARFAAPRCARCSPRPSGLATLATSRLRVPWRRHEASIAFRSDRVAGVCFKRAVGRRGRRARGISIQDGINLSLRAVPLPAAHRHRNRSSPSESQHAADRLALPVRLH